MTDKIVIDRAVVEQALKAMTDTAYGGPCFSQDVRDSLKKLRAALEQPVEQEPVAVVTGFYGGFPTIRPLEPATVLPAGMALYANPQPPRQPLTDVQVHAIWDSKYRGWFSRDQMEHITRAIEAAHGIKEQE